jgi:hypothetical protein
MGPHPKPARRLITLPAKPLITPARMPAIGSETVASVGPGSRGPPGPSSLPCGLYGAFFIYVGDAPDQAEPALTWLASTYPAVFGADVKPLVAGVGGLIWPRAKADGVGRRALNDALQRRTTSPLYLDALIADGALRFDLDGQAIEPVNAQHHECAIAMKAELALKWHGRNPPKSA